MIYIFRRFISLLFMYTLVQISFAQNIQLSNVEEARLISNLNYIQYSIAKIKAADNKAVAEDIYYSIINELRLGYIGNSSIQLAYRNFMDCCTSLKLKQNEKDFIKQLNSKAQKQAYLNAFSNLGSVFVPGQTPVQMVASLLYTTVSNAFAIANAKNQLENQLERDMFYLNQDLVRLIYSMQSNLFTTSVNVLSKSSAEGRINDDSMGLFIKILSLKSSNEKLNALKETQLMKNFQHFPPYWYELGSVYQALGDNEQAMRCYTKFISLKDNDVVGKDYNYVKLLQNQIQIYLGDSPAQVMACGIKNKEKILSAIKTIEENYLDTKSGEKNIYLAKIYYLIGETEQSLSCLNYIINSKTIYPEYIEEAIKLKDLIMCARTDDMGHFYQLAFNFSKVVFGDNNPISRHFFESTELSISNAIGYFTSSNANERFKYNPSDFSNSNFIYFTLSQNILADVNSLSVVINDMFSRISVVEDNKNKNMFLCFLDYEIDEADDIMININIPLADKINETIITYRMTHIDEDVYDAAVKAFARIGSDVSVHNAQLVCDFGKLIENYEYQVDDVDELMEDIREDKEDKAEEMKWTDIETNAAISTELNKRLSPDINFLQERLKKVKENFYKQKNVLYSPSVIWYDNEPYLVGIYSISESKTGKRILYSANGEFQMVSGKSQKPVMPDVAVDYYVSAIQGNLKAIVDLGIAYYEGYGMKPDYKEAVKWFLKAANLKKNNITNEEKVSLAKSYKYLGKCYYYGFGVKKDLSASHIWFQKAKDNGIYVEEKYLDNGWIENTFNYYFGN